MKELTEKDYFLKIICLVIASKNNFHKIKLPFGVFKNNLSQLRIHSNAAIFRLVSSMAQIMINFVINIFT